MNGSDVWQVNSPSVISEAVDGETVAINLQNGVYYSFNKTATYIWEQIESKRSTDEVASILAEKGVLPLDAARADVLGFVKRLADEELIRCGATAAGPSRPVFDAATLAAMVGVYEPPCFEKFDDLNALLLADPIHDVGEMGWPHAKPTRE